MIKRILMTVFRCVEHGEDLYRTGVHDALEFLHMMVGNSVEETENTRFFIYWS